MQWPEIDWFAPIDAYCERTSDAFWSEPLNAWTNAAFLVAAAALLPRLWALEGRPAGRRLVGAGWVLLAQITAIGLGSFAFHTFANPLAGVADVGSIAVFILTFVGVYLRLVLGAPRVAAAAAVVGVFLASIGLPGLNAGFIPGFVLAYAPAAISAFTLGAVARARGLAGGELLVAASGVFCLSMAVTALDEPLCAVWPYGTHFVWHLLNAVVLYLAVRGFFTSAKQPPAGEPPTV